MHICKFCNKQFDTKHGLTVHVKYCKNNPAAVPCKTGHVSWNKGLTAATDARVAKTLKTRADNIKSGKTVIKRPPMSDYTKMLLSEKRKQYLREHPEEHVWKRDSKFKSEPCEHLKQKLNSLGINFIEEYMPFTDSAISLDIAFPDIMVAIEVNGNQHYNKDGSLKTYYQLRHDKLTQAGWTVYEIHYTLCYSIENLKDILAMDIYNKNYVNKYFSRKEQIAKAKDELKKAKDAKKEAATIKKLKVIKNRKDLLLNSNIVFNKYGWVNEAANLLNMKPQKVSNWIKKYIPELYKKCFIRKKHIEV